MDTDSLRLVQGAHDLVENVVDLGTSSGFEIRDLRYDLLSLRREISDASPYTPDDP